MSDVYLFDISNEKTIKQTINEPDKIIIAIYEKKYRMPENTELQNITKMQNIDKLSRGKFDLFPLFDIETDDVYLVNSDNLHDRIQNRNYRFIDRLVFHSMNDRLGQYQKIANDKAETFDKYVYKMKYKKLKDAIDFINNFINNSKENIFRKQFEKKYKEYNKSEYKKYTGCRNLGYEPAFPYNRHIRTYYSLDELEKLRLIYDMKDIPNTDYDTCIEIYRRTLPQSVLFYHQKHMVIKNAVSAIQYYSLLGSYRMNMYLRDMTEFSKYKDINLENLILKLWNTIITAPAFENDFYVYRFINDDSFLYDLKIGDDYIDKGFLSTTRDPFYIFDNYSFGNILMKIKIPKNKIGIGLCMEFMSHFNTEQELLLPPNTVLILKKKDKDVNYKHTNYDFNMEIKRKYEFEIDVKSPKIKLPVKISIKTPIDPTLEISEKINKTHKDNKLNTNKIGQITTKIGNINILLTVETVQISTPYKDRNFFSSDTNKDNTIIYSIGNGKILFFIEITTDNIMFVNANDKYNYISDVTCDENNNIVSDKIDKDQFIDFIERLSLIFKCDKIYISSEYIACEVIKGGASKFVDPFGGKFNKEIYSYFKDKNSYEQNKRLKPLFDIKLLDRYFDLNMENILEYCDIYDFIQTYRFRLTGEIVINKKNSLSVAEFYIFLIEHKCYLITEMTKYISKYEKANNLQNSIFQCGLYELII